MSRATLLLTVAGAVLLVAGGFLSEVVQARNTPVYDPQTTAMSAPSEGTWAVSQPLWMSPPAQLVATAEPPRLWQLSQLESVRPAWGFFHVLVAVFIFMWLSGETPLDLLARSLH